MENNYECPRCHNVFPFSNKMMHDTRCTEQNPLPLNQSRKQENRGIQTSQNVNNSNNQNMSIRSIRSTVVIPNESNIIERPPSGEFPEVFECSICKGMFMEKEREDHMLCHDLGKSSINDSNIHSNIRSNDNNDLYASRRTIEQQKEIEREIERRNRERQQNQDNRNNNINSSSLDNNNSIHSRTSINRGNNQRSNINNYIRINDNNFNISMPYEENRNDNNSNIRVRVFINNNNNGGLNNNRRGLRISRLVSFRDFNNISINPELLRSFLSNSRNSNIYESQADGDGEVMDELAETKIEDVNKLASDKKNCVICLEDFENGDNAIFLPCIHLFHKDCILNWLKSHDNCPICKFKVSGENQ